MDDAYARAQRDRMVDEQVVRRGVADQRVIEAMRRVPRHLFAARRGGERLRKQPAAARPRSNHLAAADGAVMLEAAQLCGTERVLEVGAGSGYQAVLLAELAAAVTTIERIPELAASARAALDAAGYSRVEVVTADGSQGYPPSAPYDRILVAAGAPEVPAPLIEQLARPGRLIVPVGNRFEQKLMIVTKDEIGSISSREEGWCCFVPLLGGSGWPAPPKEWTDVTAKRPRT
jgi:protein-L-isoaspartate(D-aspartate) O-methyltransferase